MSIVANIAEAMYGATGGADSDYTPLDLPIPKPPDIAPDESKAEANARVAGFYFEACLIRRLAQLTDSPTPKFDGSQNSAILAFNKQNLSKFELNLKKQVERAAIRAAEAFHKEMLTGRKDIGIKNIATEDGGVGAILGDIQITIDNNPIVLEAKWQSSQSYATRWFSDMSDSSLFGGGFSSFLGPVGQWGVNQNPHWSFRYKGYWKNTIANTVLPKFLASHKPDSAALIRYLLHKGEKGMAAAKGVKSKYVVHGTFAGFTITNLADINLAMGEDVQRKVKKESTRGVMRFNNASGETVATFGLSKFRNMTASKAAHKGDDGSLPLSTTFAFQMYFHQRFVSHWAPELATGL